MRIEQFEEIEHGSLPGSQFKVYGLTKKAKFSRDFGLKGQIRDAVISFNGFRG